MSTSANQSTAGFSEVVGSNSRSRLLEYLATTDGSARQFEIASALDISQASVSRAASDLIEDGVISRGSDGGLLIRAGVKRGIILVQESMANQDDN